MTKTVAFIQARMSSSRFPGKVLEPLQGMPMIVYMVRRASRACLLDGVVVVTSTDPSDDPLAACLTDANIAVFRGDLHDVLKRYADAARVYEADVAVRLTGDCPLIDPGVIDLVIETRRRNGVDYANNVDPPTYPHGLDTECFTRDALERAHRLAKLPAEREHVTLWMRSDAAGLRRAEVRAIADFSCLRLTVDYPDDLAAVRRIVEHVNGPFDLFDLLRALSVQPDLLSLIRHARNEGLMKSLSQPMAPMNGQG